MICYKCNSEVPEGSLFCNRCGSLLEVKKEEFMETTKAVDVDLAGSDSISSNNRDLDNLDNKVILKKSSRHGISFIIVLIAVAAFSIFMYVSNQLSENIYRSDIETAFNAKKWDNVIDLINNYEKTYIADEKINEMLSLAYTNSKAESQYKEADALYQNKNYEEAYKKIIEINKRADIYTEVIKRQEELAKIIIVENLSAAKKSIENKEYVEAFECIKEVLQLEPNNEEATSLQKKYEKKYEAQVEEIRKKADAEAKKKAEAEAAKYAPKKIIDKDGKQIWKVYIANGSIHFSGTYKGSGNFIVKLSDSNQDLVEVIANEIGDFISNKTVIVPYVGWYYLEVYGSDGSWEYSWD